MGLFEMACYAFLALWFHAKVTSCTVSDPPPLDLWGVACLSTESVFVLALTVKFDSYADSRGWGLLCEVRMPFAMKGKTFPRFDLIVL